MTFSSPDSAASAEKDGRRINRLGLAVPARVECKVNQTVSWNEITRLTDVSQFGAGFNLPRPIKRGRLIYMTIPLPRQLRSFDYSEPQYRIWGLVRRCISFRKYPTAPETYAVGTAFIGKRPPQSYLDDPSKLYDAVETEGEGFWNIFEADARPDESNLPKEHRRHSRYPIPMSIMLESLDEDGEITSSESTVTENISLSGASVFTTLPSQVGSFVRVNSEQFGVSIMSIVRGRRGGKDGFPRLHLEFIDRYFPLEGIE